MLTERDSEPNRNVEESRANALASVASIDMETSSSLLEQFQTEYVIGAQLFHCSHRKRIGLARLAWLSEINCSQLKLHCGSKQPKRG